MRNNLKNRFVQLCRNLQDPHHVATFQKLCGVRGTFSVKSNSTEGKDLFNTDTYKDHYQGEIELIDGATGGPKPDGIWQRKNVIEKPNVCSNNILNRITSAEGDMLPGVNNPFESSRGLSKDQFERLDNGNETCDSRELVKPLRKNSLTGDIGQEFIIENKFLFYLFTFGTELGNEMFFIIFFPFLIWNVDAYVSRRLIVVWVWVLFIGQTTKDLVRWRRPASPPVVKVEVFYNSEYSMPSTHAMSGTAIPFSLFLLTNGRWEYPFLFGLSLAICWSFLVCVSRVYMGMHSILEVITGFLYSLLILAAFQPALDLIDGFYLTNHHASVVIVIIHVGMGLLAFLLDSWSTSRGDTAQALGTGAGAALGSHFNHQLGLLSDVPLSQLPLSLPSLNTTILFRIVLRLLVGVTVLLAARTIMKAVTIPLACYVFGLPTNDMRRARQHMEVELPYRYIVYGMVGFSCVCLVPLLFRSIHLS